MRVTKEMQAYRIHDLFNATEEQKGKTLKEFLLEKISERRTPSSVEEELVTRLPIFDNEDNERITQKAIESAQKAGIEIKGVIDEEISAIITRGDPEFEKELRALGLVNFQKEMQLEFYQKAKPLLDLSRRYEFPARYEAITPAQILGVKAACIEQFTYGRSLSYASMFYHMMRHLANLNGSESPEEIEYLARKAVSGRRILELGCGPGFFLYVLKQLGAYVTGVDKNESFREQTAKAGLNVICGDAKNLQDLVSGKQDIVISKDFLSLAVTRDDAGPIMEASFRAMKPGAIALHQIEYSKMPEEKYFAMIDEAGKKGADAEKIKRNFSELPPEQRDMLLRKNIFNISPAHIEQIGYKLITGFKHDLQEFLTLTMVKPR